MRIKFVKNTFENLNLFFREKYSKKIYRLGYLLDPIFHTKALVFENVLSRPWRGSVKTTTILWEKC